ncbi:MAG TPA: hypothetical protein VFS63_13510 [Pseudolabrys sp.]|jgi:hypothetical protein|nr:hypothetical protein [Pseudolabrys sp.]
MTTRATIHRFTSRMLTAIAVVSAAGILLVAAAAPSQAGGVRDHRGSKSNGSATVRDHRSGWGQGEVRDHRNGKNKGWGQGKVRDHRKPIVTFHGLF